MGTMIDFQAAEGTWFEFFNSKVEDDNSITYAEPSPDAATVCIRSPNDFFEERARTRKKVTKMVPNPKTRGMDAVKVDADLSPEQMKKENEDLWDFVIVDFEGFTDAKGNEILPTRENKLKLMKIPAFDRFVAAVMKRLGEDAIVTEKALDENL